ncbi:hypothetical protein JL720_9209 [Aureococcus anophagefferens]|nr:hypothetical protein JL720_9209 [Aureococcus anophagefferens]
MADADLQLFSSTKERRRYTDLADFYAIIKATEHLEKAYARDAIDEARYEKACLKLISQFKSSESALKLGGGIEDASSFIAEWRMDCRDRLVRCGAPATVLHATDAGDASETVRVAECVQHFITAMDAPLDQRRLAGPAAVADLAAGPGACPTCPARRARRL